jgi:hypothetical protein
MKVIWAAALILWTAGVKAQTGMPQALTCTERAFNFSFSLGSNWKLGAPKMGPVESVYYLPEQTLLWHSKVKWHPFLNRPVADTSRTKLSGKSRALFPGLHFTPLANY